MTSLNNIPYLFWEMYVLFNNKVGEDKGSKNTKQQIIHFLWIREGGAQLCWATKLEMCSRERSRATGQSCTGPPGTWREQALGHQAEEVQQGDGVEQQGEGVEQQGEGLEKQAGFVLGYQAGDV